MSWCRSTGRGRGGTTLLLPEVADELTLGESLLLTWAPILVIGLVGWWALRRVNRKPYQHIDASREHMQRMEAKADRANELLERIAKRLEQE